MNTAVKFPLNSKSKYLTPAQIEEFGAKIEAIRLEVMNDLGEKDARYIYKVRDFVRYTEIASRGMLMFAGWIPPVWLVATGMLGVSKIVENMELAHNVMHGQYDWLNDDSLRGNDYDWDNVCTGEDWRYTHNYLHHTYTNIIGQDHDVGYGILRVSAEQPWELRFLFNLPLAAQLMLFFEWYVGIQSLHLEDAVIYKTKSWKQVWIDSQKARKKITRQLAKDYVFFPAISTINFIPVFAGNFTANIIRNLWSSAVIFNGHFTEDAENFQPDNTATETRAQFYLRQIRGSSNFTGGKTLHFLSGNLSHQIEHHLFPDMPANRYQDIAPKVRAICEEYGINYNSASFTKQFATVWMGLAKLSLPQRHDRERIAAKLKHKMTGFFA
ncbi:acyl-CoA desaturase [Acinetobacter puyangensis]|uniref:Fatty acid desaturase n=1 Tax=Acinetobacter puyangensis TaxID=1096779 RepID=A0A240EBG2_9GAMM|nr:Fatty acid desaturase [Acinetobacter puyangensis]